jgi:hypothetical protein
MFTYSNVPRCHYIKVNGTRCGSPALRNQKLCYFHERWHEQRVTLRGYPGEQNQVQLPVLEDANSIQMALTQVMRLVLDQKISNKEAGLLLYALQIASNNLKRTKFEVGDEKEVVVDPGTLANAGVGINSWKASDFPSPIPSDPAPDAASAFTPDAAQPVYVAEKKIKPQPAVIPELKAVAEESDTVEDKRGWPTQPRFSVEWERATVVDRVGGALKPAFGLSGMTAVSNHSADLLPISRRTTWPFHIHNPERTMIGTKMNRVGVAYCGILSNGL